MKQLLKLHNFFQFEKIIKIIMLMIEYVIMMNYIVVYKRTFLNSLGIQQMLQVYELKY